MLIPGSLDGIETGVRQLIRSEPLDTETVEWNGQSITIPTEPEILRVKAVLILRRNAMRDYLDFAALGCRMKARQGGEGGVRAMASFDRLYPQDSGESALQQLLGQLSPPAFDIFGLNQWHRMSNYDLEEANPERFRSLAPELSRWESIEKICNDLAQDLFRGHEVTCQDRSAGEDLFRSPSPFD